MPASHTNNARPSREVASTVADMGGRVPVAVGSGVYVTPRTSAPAPDDCSVRVRVVRQAGGLLVHVTAATPEAAEYVVAKLFGRDQPFIVELCG